MCIHLEMAEAVLPQRHMVIESVLRQQQTIAAAPHISAW